MIDTAIRRKKETIEDYRKPELKDKETLEKGEDKNEKK